MTTKELVEKNLKKWIEDEGYYFANNGSQGEVLCKKGKVLKGTTCTFYTITLPHRPSMTIEEKRLKRILGGE